MRSSRRPIALTWFFQPTKTTWLAIACVQVRRPNIPGTDGLHIAIEQVYHSCEKLRVKIILSLSCGDWRFSSQNITTIAERISQNISLAAQDARQGKSERGSLVKSLTPTREDFFLENHFPLLITTNFGLSIRR